MYPRVQYSRGKDHSKLRDGDFPESNPVLVKLTLRPGHPDPRNDLPRQHRLWFSYWSGTKHTSRQLSNLIYEAEQ